MKEEWVTVDGRGMQNLHFMGLQEQSKLYAVMVFMLKKEKLIHNLQDNSNEKNYIK